MHVYPQDFIAGLRETLALHKQGENVFDMGNVAMFPTIQKQTMWRFARSDKKLQLTDGVHIYHFELPDGEGNGDFLAIRHADAATTQFGTGAEDKTGPAQVHRADPGSIYFTLQEGDQNPTYTIRHVGGSKWKGIPKKKTTKKTVEQPIPMPEKHVEVMKHGVAMEIFKEAGFLGDTGELLNMSAGEAVHHGGNAAFHGVMLPGEHPLGYALAAAAAGGAYHLGKRNLYNTDEENAEEDQYDPHAWIKRIAIPAAGVGLLGTAEKSLFTGSPTGKPLYYDQIRMGLPRTNMFG